MAGMVRGSSLRVNLSSAAGAAKSLKETVGTSCWWLNLWVRIFDDVDRSTRRRELAGKSRRTSTSALHAGAYPGSEMCGTTTSCATAGSVGMSHLNNAVAAAAPINCAAMKPGTSMSRIPLKVSVAALASDTAGFANDVDAVNQYAAVM